MDLLRLALERCRTAGAAVDEIRRLIQAHGQGGGCGYEQRGFTYHNSFLIADPRSAFVLETAGRATAVEPVSGIRTLSNGLTIPSFAARHSDPLRSAVSRCRTRQARTTGLAQNAGGVAELMAILRDHGPESRSPRYSPLNGAMAAPCMHAGGLLANAQTTGSWVAELRPVGTRHWVTGTAAPCLSLFKPVDVRQPVASASREDLFWRNERLHRRVTPDFERQARAYVSERNTIEAGWLRDVPVSAQAFAVGDDLLARWTAKLEAAPPDETRPWWAARYWCRRALRPG